jgi:hypothetical protein
MIAPPPQMTRKDAIKTIAIISDFISTSSAHI